MLVNSGTPVTMRFKRSGGSIIQSRVDVWKATPAGWGSAAVFDFEEAKKPEDSETKILEAGEYTCICRCYVRESVNGVYRYELIAGDGRPCKGEGDVNTTSADGDSQVFRCQFILRVSP